MSVLFWDLKTAIDSKCLTPPSPLCLLFSANLRDLKPPPPSDEWHFQSFTHYTIIIMIITTITIINNIIIITIIAITITIIIITSVITITSSSSLPFLSKSSLNLGVVSQWPKWTVGFALRKRSRPPLPGA